MKNIIIGIGFVCLALGLGCSKDNAEQATPLPPVKPVAKKVLASFHYIGAAQLAGNTNASQLRKIWALPETVRFREVVLNRLAKAPQQFFPKEGTNAAVDPSAWLRPLLDDVIQAESYGELREEGKGTASIFLAFQLKDDRAQIWSSNLWQTALAWQGVPPVALTNVSPAGWEAQRMNQTPVFRFLRAGQWVVITTGSDQTHSNLLAKIALEGRPIAAATTNWFDSELDSQQCQRWFAALPIKNFPSAHMTITGKGENLRTNMRLSFAEPVPWKPEPWLIPTNLIKDPANGLVSFAALRGIAPLLKDLPAVNTLGWAAPPNQLYFWSYRQVPFGSYAAAPVPNASNVLRQLEPRVPALLGTNLLRPANGQILGTSNQPGLIWIGLPVVTPHIFPVEKPEGEFLSAGLFYAPPFTNAPMPPELIASLSSSSNICYYQWEITQARLAQWRSLYSLFYVVASLPLASPITPGQQWLTSVSTNLGNSVTEMTVNSPTEMRLVRNSHLNLTGLEIAQLIHWIESTRFPFGGFQFLPELESPIKKAAPRPQPKSAAGSTQKPPAPGGQPKP